MTGRVPDGTGLSQAEPQEGLGPSGFDPSRIRTQIIEGIAYVVPRFEPLASFAYRRGEYALAGFVRMGSFCLGVELLRSGVMIQIGPCALAFLHVESFLARDSDGSPQGGDGEAGSVRSTTARASPK